MSKITVSKNGPIATVTLSNPGKLNALNLDMWLALQQTCNALSKDESLRCVIVQGEGDNFAAGADIEEFPAVRGTIEQGIHYHTEVIEGALQAVADCLHPTIAAIEGVCVGGGLEIACACDLRIASTTSRFGIPINRLGFPLAPGELRGLLDLVGKAVALELLLEGRILTANAAQGKGLVHRVVDDLASEVQQSAARIAIGAPLAARMHKKLIRRLSPQSQALTAQELRDAFVCLESDDYREGVQSFLEKRAPEFKGR